MAIDRETAAGAAGNVTSLFGGLVPGETCPEIVADLRRLLEQAERGEIRGLAYAVARGSDFADHGYHYSRGGLFALAAGVTALHHHIAAHLAEGD